MKKADIGKLFPTLNPNPDDQAKESLIDAILQRLEVGGDKMEDEIAQLLVKNGAKPDEAKQAAVKIIHDYQADDGGDGKKEKEDWKSTCNFRPVSGWIFALLIAILAGVLATVFMLAKGPSLSDLTAATAGLATKTDILNATDPLATSEQLTTATDTLANATADIAESQKKTSKAMERLEEATKDLATKTDVKDATDPLATSEQLTTAMKRLEEATAGLATKDDVSALGRQVAEVDAKVTAVNISVNRTEEIVTTGLTTRARCRVDDDHTDCTGEVDCKGQGDEKRCYKRIPFQAASAGQVERLRKELTIEPVEVEPEAAPAPAPKAEPTAPAACPTGCVRDCPTGCKPVSSVTTHQLVPVS